MHPLHSFETRPGPVGRPGTRPTRGRNRAGLMKKQGKEKPGWPGGSTRLTRQDPVTNPLTFVFFLFFLLKRRRFDFFFKNWPGRPGQTRWPGQNPEPGPWTGPGLKTLIRWVAIFLFFAIYVQQQYQQNFYMFFI
jgi:hypothetical protein